MLSTAKINLRKKQKYCWTAKALYSRSDRDIHQLVMNKRILPQDMLLKWGGGGGGGG